MEPVLDPRPIVEALPANLQRVRQRIAQAARRAGRTPDAVRLVAVTKYVPLEVIEALLRLGVREIGENRVQALRQRAERLGCDPTPWPQPPGPAAAPRWHMIGHLQRNKVKHLLGVCRIVHSLDSPKLAAEIGKIARRLDPTGGLRIDTLIEVNVSGEESKHGVTPDELPALVEAVASEPAIRLRGLMTMAPYVEDPERTRPVFAKLRELAGRLRERGLVGEGFNELSMGMSNDFEVAIEEGATIVRLGSVLYETGD